MWGGCLAPSRKPLALSKRVTLETTSLWLKDLPLSDQETVPELPDRADVVIIGGGYTGVSAARAVALAGASVVVLERETPGWGASTRNGGFVLPGFKRELSAIARKWGPSSARRLFAESLESINHLESLIATEGIACGFRRSGHITLAESPGQFRDLERERDLLRATAGHETRVLARAEIGSEVGSTRYAGGLLDESAAALQPAQLFFGLARAATGAGALILARTDARRIEGSPGGFTVLTSRGPIQAGHVLVATNGYSGAVHPPLRRRLISIGSHIIATQPLGRDLGRRIIPGARILNDSRHLLHYFRLSDDGRLIFGGRASFRTSRGEADAAAHTILERDMVRVFPELAGVTVEYAWSGNVAFTLDQMPHMGTLDGALSAGGYCGHGVAMAIYVGTRAGQYLADGRALPFLAALDFPVVPLYDGHPWFLPLAGAWYRLLDWTRGFQ